MEEVAAVEHVENSVLHLAVVVELVLYIMVVLVAEGEVAF